VIFAALVVLAGSPCETTPPVPAVPLASQFECPKSTERVEDDGLLVCRQKDGRLTEDSFGKGIITRSEGMAMAWIGSQVMAFGQRHKGLPVGDQVIFDPQGRVAKHELYDVKGNLVCARHYREGRLIRSAEGTTWHWYDAQGRAVGPQVPLERDEITATLTEHQNEVRTCYEKRLAEVKGVLKGEVEVEFDVRDGDVSNVHIAKDDLHDSGVTDCIAARIAKWKFRPATEETTVAFPWVFTPVEDK
jgi:hypothetical protein